MTTWTLDWNDLTQEQKDHIKNVAEIHECCCMNNAGQMALELFNATVEVIKMRDRAEIQATLGELWQ